MNWKIVADSSSNLMELDGMEYTSVPLKIITDQKEYVDCPGLDVKGMVEDLQRYKGKSGSSCPNAQEWIDSFGEAEAVFGVTISSNLSGSYAAAIQAAEDHRTAHPGAKVFTTKKPFLPIRPRSSSTTAPPLKRFVNISRNMPGEPTFCLRCNR